MSIVSAEQLRDQEEGPLTGRVPPHNDEAEMALLGALLQNNRAYERVSEFLKPEHFANRVHGRLYEAIGSLIGRGKIADQITLRQYFEADGDLTEVGGWSYIMQISRSVVSIINAADYANTIHDLATRRQLIDLGFEAIDLGHSGSIDLSASEMLEQVEARLTEIALDVEPDSAAQTVAEVMPSYLAGIEEVYKNPKGRVIGISSGIHDVDRLVGGLKSGKLYLLAARTGMGKTAMACTIARNAARNEGTPSAIFELEMGSEELVARFIARETGIDTFRQEHGPLSDDDFDRICEASAAIHDLPIHIDDKPKLSVAQIRARARRLKRRKKLGLIVVDHAGLVRPENPKLPRHEQLGQISLDLKNLAKELKVPVLLLCQLNRGVEGRDDKRPSLSDLKESGSLEENADVVMFIFREEYYLERAEPQQRDGEAPLKFDERRSIWSDRLRDARNLAELIAAKARGGRTGMAQIIFNGEHASFYQQERQQDMPL